MKIPGEATMAQTSREAALRRALTGQYADPWSQMPAVARIEESKVPKALSAFCAIARSVAVINRSGKTKTGAGTDPDSAHQLSGRPGRMTACAHGRRTANDGGLGLQDIDRYAINAKTNHKPPETSNEAEGCGPSPRLPDTPN